MIEVEVALSDEDLYDLAKAEGGESFPAEVVDRLITGDSPLKVYREYRDLTQKELAKAAGVSAMYVSQIERGNREGSSATLKKLAAALKVELADIAPVE